MPFTVDLTTKICQRPLLPQDRVMRLFFLSSIALLSLTTSSPAGTPGEFSLPDVVPIPMSAVMELRELVATDPEAAARVETIAERARQHLGEPATPLEVIHYEGLVNTDPKRIETVSQLKQAGEAGDLIRYWQATGDLAAAKTLADWILAWFTTYEPTGNDVNENKFFPLLTAYYYLRDQFPEEEREQVDAFVEEIGELHAKAVKQSDHLTNRYTKHVRLAAICGMILDRPEWVDTAQEGVKRFVTASLFGDGTSRDLRRRDTLTYHSSALRPPMQLAMLQGPEAIEIYTWENEKGGSIKKSVDYVVPYATGEKTREEWKNSKIGLDRRRAEAGLEKYQPGQLYDPKDATDLMELASFFDPSLHAVVMQLSESDAERFPTWQTLLNAAMARSLAD